MPAPQQQLYSQIDVNQHNNPVVAVQSSKPQPIPGLLPAIIPSHYLSENIQQQAVVYLMHPVHVKPSTNPASGYQQQQIVNIPMKEDEYAELSPDTTPKQEENSSYSPPSSIDVNEIFFYPDKVLASYVPSGSESFKPLPTAY